MTNSQLDDWLERIGTEHPKSVLGGLERVSEVAQRANLNPPAPLNFIVAGTNGKGSTSVFLEQLLLATGRSVGTTLSPHVERFNERIRVNGKEASDLEIVQAFGRIESVRESTPLTYFEYAILAGFDVFRSHEVDATVLEVGLGGRLDATNIVDADVAVIVSVALDHQDYLGNTREAIGSEKAGVIRGGCPVVYGESRPPRSVIERAKILNAPLYVYEADFRDSGAADGWSVELANEQSVYVGLAPQIARRNAATACQAFVLVNGELDADVLKAACLNAFLPCRVEVFEEGDRRWIVDVAHNPHSASFLAGAVKSYGRVGCAIVGMLKDKDHVAVIQQLQSFVDRWIVTGTGSERGLSAQEISERLWGTVSHIVEPDLDQAMKVARSTTDPNSVILVFGSFDLVGRARARLIPTANLC